MEKTVLVTIYKQAGKLYIECNKEEVYAYELYGFLKCYLEVLKEALIDEMDVI